MAVDSLYVVYPKNNETCTVCTIIAAQRFGMQLPAYSLYRDVCDCHFPYGHKSNLTKNARPTDQP
ncbi:hypothetical protein QTP88_013643 [Uroleucon formosanum]